MSYRLLHGDALHCPACGLALDGHPWYALIHLLACAVREERRLLERMERDGQVTALASHARNAANLDMLQLPA